MIRGSYAFAGITAEIESFHGEVHHLCREYAVTSPPDFRVTIGREDLRAEAEKAPVANLPEDYLETLAVYRKIAEKMPDFDTLLFHGSAIAVDGVGYLFTAKSGTGKSTHTRLWREAFGDRAFMVNDDKPLLKITEAGVLVCGTPWDGKHHLSRNCMVPLKAICVLSRGAENEIPPIPPAQALPRLLEQCYRPEGTQALLKTLTLLDSLSGKVHFYALSCNMDPEAALISRAGMDEQRGESEAQ